MGWATYLTTRITYNRKTYNSIYDVQNDLDDTNKLIEYLEQKLRKYVIMTEPAKWFNTKDIEGDNLFDTINNNVDNIIEELEESYIERYKLNLLIEQWDNCHDKETGLGKEEPDDWHWDTSFISGDFVKTDKTEIKNE